MRIVRICARKEDREKRFEELRDLLLARDYRHKIIERSFVKCIGNGFQSISHCLEAKI